MRKRLKPTKEQIETINRAIEALGGITKTAARYRITIPAVQLWRTRGVPDNRVRKIARDTGIPEAEFLRPFASVSIAHKPREA